MIGRLIGKYRILEKLGRGGMGTVYRAADQASDRQVAITVLNPQMEGSDVLAVFEAEARTLAALNTPEIAVVYEVQHTGQDLLIATELVRGESLDDLLKRAGVLSPERAAYLAAQVLGALAQAHAAGVVHRDLKPSNVMITELGGVKVLDFAVARVAGAEQMTAVASMVGTPAYMSPERILGNDIDGRADLYSVGVLFYRLLTDALPFQSTSPTEMVEKQLSEAPTPARLRRPDLPEWCEEVLARALAKAPEDRFQTAGTFRSALLDAIGQAATDRTSMHEVMSSAPLIPLAMPAAKTATRAVSLAAIPEVDAAPPSRQAEPDIDLTVGRLVPTERTAWLSPSDSEATVATPVANDDAPTALAPAAWETAHTTSAWSNADAPTVLGEALRGQRGDEPAEYAAAALAATVSVPVESAPAGATLVMKRKQFAVAAAVLGTLAIGVVVLAIIVVKRSGTAVVVQSPDSSPGASAAGVSATVTPQAVEAPAPPPLEIVDPPIRTTPAEAPPSPPLAQPRQAARREPPPAVAPAAATAAAPAPARVTSAVPFQFEARAVVTEGDKHRERDATVLIADGTVTVSQQDKVLYSVPVATLMGLTYSTSRQPLWNSPSGPAEAMRVESGAFGFLKGGRNWLGLRTSEYLLVLRVDDSAVSRVITALQDRTGLPVARLIEPKE